MIRYSENFCCHFVHKHCHNTQSLHEMLYTTPVVFLYLEYYLLGGPIILRVFCVFMLNDVNSFLKKLSDTCPTLAVGLPSSCDGLGSLQ